MDRRQFLGTWLGGLAAGIFAKRLRHSPGRVAPDPESLCEEGAERLARERQELWDREARESARKARDLVRERIRLRKALEESASLLDA